ncbi:MAG TPA: ABC transporter ATP-binding protein [Blastococcus sp.]|jgi:ABC-type multidrug transport system fused ATPase/permease subunit|nr:ABC transporter ATP-binding protein [Blastococcus sp.]
MPAHAAPPRPGALQVAGPYLRPERRRLALGAALATLEIGCRLLEPWPLALAIDYALEGRPLTGAMRLFSGLGTTGLLIAAGLATVLVSVVGGVVDTGSRAISERAAERIGGAMRAAVFAHVLALSLRWHDRMRTGEIISRLTSDVARVLDALEAICTYLLPNVLLLVGALGVLMIVDPPLALLGLLVMPVLAWLTAQQRHRVRSAELAARDASGRLTATATDLLRNVRAVQAFGRLDRAAALFGVPNQRTVDTKMGAVATSARWAPVPDVVLAVGTGIVLVVGGLQVGSGLLTVGELLVVLMYLGYLESPVRSLVRLTTTRAKASVSAVRLQQILGCTEAVQAPAASRPVPPVREGLRLESVWFSYSEDRPVLATFDLTVAAGETVCLFGPSGAGKSTVLQLLLRLYDVDAGRVLVDGVDVRELSPVELRHSLAFVPQDPWLLDATIAENIAFGSSTATRAQVLAAGRAAWVDEFALSLPQGYDTPLGESGVQLSGGQRRRVALARAVVSEAPVVLLDEPTTSLDAEAARQVIGAIRSATRDRTVLLVTHDPVLAAIADRTVHVAPLWRSAPDPALGSGAAPVGHAGSLSSSVGTGADRDPARTGAPRPGGR